MSVKPILVLLLVGLIVQLSQAQTNNEDGDGGGGTVCFVCFFCFYDYHYSSCSYVWHQTMGLFILLGYNFFVVSFAYWRFDLKQNDLKVGSNMLLASKVLLRFSIYLCIC